MAKSSINYELIEQKVEEKGCTRKSFMSYIYGESGNKGMSVLRNSDPRLSTCIKICKFLDISLDELTNENTSDQSQGGNTIGNNNKNCNITVNDNAQREITYLRSEIESMKLIVASKDETINTYQQLVEQIQRSKDENISLYERNQ